MNLNEIKKIKETLSRYELDNDTHYYGMSRGKAVEVIRIAEGLIAEVERKDRQLEEAQKTIATAYGIACEEFESVNQMELIRLTLGEFLQALRGESE